MPTDCPAGQPQATKWQQAYDNARSRNLEHKTAVLFADQWQANWPDPPTFSQANDLLMAALDKVDADPKAKAERARSFADTVKARQESDPEFAAALAEFIDPTEEQIARTKQIRDALMGMKNAG